MRNKSAFNPPQVHNSFRKSDRVYPEPAPIEIMKEGEQKKKGKIVEKFCFTVQHPPDTFDFGSMVNSTQNTYIWYYLIENSNLKNSKRKIRFQKSTYFISNWEGDEFPMCINLCIEGFNGFLNHQGKRTNRCVVLKMKNVATISNDYNSKVYDVMYEQEGENQWELPQEMTALKFYLTTDENETKISLPLPNPMVMEFEITFE